MKIYILRMSIVLTSLLSMVLEASSSHSRKSYRYEATLDRCEMTFLNASYPVFSRSGSYRLDSFFNNLKAVYAGQKQFHNFWSTVANYAKLHQGYSMQEQVSMVHDDEEVIAQSMVLAVTADRDSEIVQKMSFMAEAEHRLDDEWDRPDLVPYELLERIEPAVYNNDMDAMWKGLGAITLLIAEMHAMVEGPERKAAVQKSIWRILMGALIQRAPSERLFKKYLRLYHQKGVLGIDDQVKVQLIKTSDYIYWMSTKTALEAMFALEEQEYNPTLAELWNHKYSSILYYSDIHAEKKMEGQTWLLPRSINPVKIRKMLKIVKNNLPRFPDRLRRDRLDQDILLLDLYRDAVPEEILSYQHAINTYLKENRH